MNKAQQEIYDYIQQSTQSTQETITSDDFITYLEKYSIDDILKILTILQKEK